MGSLLPGFDPFQRARELEREVGANDRVGDFELLELLGEGGFARVYRARDASGREVALKLLSRRAAAQVERFRREAVATAALDHPHVLRIHGAGEVEGQPYLVTELVRDCQPLDAALARVGREAGLDLLLQAASGLAHAHARGIAHRDVKPANLLVDATGRVRVGDFGLALAREDERLTRSGAIFGTPGYMAPEQALGQVASEHALRCDVWALGVILYRVLCGVAPFEHLLPLGCPVTPQVALRPPREHDPTVPPALEQVCLRALRWEPRERYPDAAAFAEALQAARAPSASASRAWVLAGLVGGAGVLGLLGFVVGGHPRPAAEPASPAEAPSAPVARLVPPAGAEVPLPSDPAQAAQRVQELLAWGAPQVALDLVRRARAAGAPPELGLCEARALLELERYPEALGCLRHLREGAAGPSPEVLDACELAVLVRQGRIRPALSRAPRLLERLEALPLDVFLEATRPLSERGVPLDLTPFYARAREHFGWQLTLELAWAHTLAKHGRDADCDAVLAEVERRAGASPALDLVRARTACEGGQLERAAEALRELGPAVESQTRWRWLLLRGEVHARLGRAASARDDLELLEAAQGPPSWRLHLLRARIELGERRLQAAEEALIAGRALSPRPELELMRAEVLIARERTDEAQELLLRWVEADPATVGKSLCLRALSPATREARLEVAVLVAPARKVLPLREAHLWQRLRALEAELNAGEEEPR